jgi:arylsulfatase A-like enzyme
MNIVVIMLDSLRQDHVSFYGWEGCPVKTPHLDSLAAEAIVFDNVYPEGLPTIPVRTDLFTGQSSLTNRTWQPLVPTDVTCMQLFRKEGYLTALVADTYHLFKPDMNFHRACDIFHWIRGAEYDACKAGPLQHLKLEDHITDRMPENWRNVVLTALRNLDGRVEPQDFPCWQTMEQSLRVLEQARQAARPVFLWIDTFQPHEPWCPPAKFDVYGDPSYRGPKVVLPPGGPAEKWGTEEIFERTRSLYAGEAAYVDFCVGHLLKGMRQMGYLNDSVIVVLSDHGHPLADHGKFLKGPDRMYSELLKVPFIVRLPFGAHGGRRVTALGRFPDLTPTLLDLAGLGTDNLSLAGKSLMPVIEGTGTSPYKATISGFFPGVDRSIRNERYSYVIRPEGQAHELYDLLADPREKCSLIDDGKEIAQALLNEIGSAYFGRQAKPRGVQGTYEVAHTALA